MNIKMAESLFLGILTDRGIEMEFYYVERKFGTALRRDEGSV